MQTSSHQQQTRDLIDGLKSVHSVLPDKKVADAFCQLIAPIFERQRTAELQNVELTRLRDWLLPLLMNAQVRVA